MMQLGSHDTTQGKHHLIYFEDEKLGLAIGPFDGSTIPVSIVAQVRAESAEKARKILIKVLDEETASPTKKMLERSGVGRTVEIESDDIPTFTKRGPGHDQDT